MSVMMKAEEQQQLQQQPTTLTAQALFGSGDGGNQNDFGPTAPGGESAEPPNMQNDFYSDYQNNPFFNKGEQDYDQEEEEGPMTTAQSLFGGADGGTQAIEETK